MMDDALSWDLIKLFAWNGANRLDFHVTETQSCFLTHRKIDAQPLPFGGVSIEEQATLDAMFFGEDMCSKCRKMQPKAYVF